MLPFAVRSPSTLKLAFKIDKIKLLIREIVFCLYMKRDHLDFCVNVKEFLEFFVTREKAQYFYVNEFWKGV